jgi:hypothetical protein
MTVFSDVLANVAFLFGEEDQPGPAAEGAWLETSISYRGPCQGRLRFRCPRAFAKLLATNLLGIDPEDNDAESKSEDAVKELMNILCGQMITAMHGTGEVFDLSIPVTRELDSEPDLAGGDDPGTSTLSVEGHCVQLTHWPGEADHEG